MSLAQYSKALSPDAHGIWTATQAVAVNYPESGNEACFELEDASFWFGHRNDCIAAVVKRFPPVGTILDVGGGNGFVARRLLDEGFETAVMEPGPVGALNAKVQRGIPEVLCCTLEDAGFESGSLSAVGFFDVLEHVEDDAALLSQACTALKPGGMVYVTVPAGRWLWSYSDEYAQHFRRYDRQMVETLLGGRFEILYFTRFFAPLVLPVAALRALPYRLGLARKRETLSRETEHGTGGGFGARALAWLLRREAAGIAAGRTMALGTSWLCAARKRGGV